jgi:hypothetical protein
VLRRSNLRRAKIEGTVSDGTRRAEQAEAAKELEELTSRHPADRVCTGSAWEIRVGRSKRVQVTEDVVLEGGNVALEVGPVLFIIRKHQNRASLPLESRDRRLTFRFSPRTGDSTGPISAIHSFWLVVESRICLA